MQFLVLTDAGVVGPATERLVLMVDSEGSVFRIKADKKRRNSHEEKKILSMSKWDVIGRNSEHSARVPHQLPVRLALRLRIVLDALQNAVHLVSEQVLIRRQE